MNSIITYILSNLTADFTLTMPGWAWLVALPVSVVILGIIFYAFGYFLMLKSLRLWS